MPFSVFCTVVLTPSQLILIYLLRPRQLKRDEARRIPAKGPPDFIGIGFFPRSSFSVLAAPSGRAKRARSCSILPFTRSTRLRSSCADCEGRGGIACPRSSRASSFYADTATLVASVARIVVERALPAYLFPVIAVFIFGFRQSGARPSGLEWDGMARRCVVLSLSLASVCLRGSEWDGMGRDTTPTPTGLICSRLAPSCFISLRDADGYTLGGPHARALLVLPAYLFLVIAVSSSSASVCVGLGIGRDDDGDWADLRFSCAEVSQAWLSAPFLLCQNGTGWDGDFVLGRRCPRPPFARSAQTWTHTVEGSSMPAIAFWRSFRFFIFNFRLSGALFAFDLVGMGRDGDESCSDVEAPALMLHPIYADSYTLSCAKGSSMPRPLAFWFLFFDFHLSRRFCFGRMGRDGTEWDGIGYCASASS
ncbi:hypothetical protein C8R45DRAFT_1215942 [Mycena sanguinolenta]|nr:hypothetical protein C8R45DRAFT_1215942 [Mycena sanguinolenta]